ncbi:IclR family transcriptional regulator [Peribacillus frigoritolerans]|uniref:IclR family transcriptional regulator n=1 Tax=Peribacillus frigoritolerans TaxID=450367 RepID=UPI002280DC3E|nr:IclR family transcriptional regulator [Peribacillus frigoritolerans]MCY8939358.1 IclR family transcriptional regulator [Peribacillus frigoritolerans]
MASEEKEKEKYSANSLVRGLEIIKLFNEVQPSLSLSEIAKQLGVSRTVPYRLLFTLQNIGYLSQDEHTKRYSLTPKVLELGFSYLNSLKFQEIVQPYMETLRDEIGASCHLSILDGQEVVYVGSAPIRGVSAVNVNIGLRLPAHALANGKLLLAYQPKELLMQMFKISNLTPYTDKTLTTPGEFQKQLDSIRQNGYSMTSGEFHPGIRSVAAPIFDRTGKVLAALNVVATESAYQEDFIDKIALPKLLEVSRQLSVYMGYSGVKPYQHEDV